MPYGTPPRQYSYIPYPLSDGGWAEDIPLPGGTQMFQNEKMRRYHEGMREQEAQRPLDDLSRMQQELRAIMAEGSGPEVQAAPGNWELLKKALSTAAGYLPWADYIKGVSGSPEGYQQYRQSMMQELPSAGIGLAGAMVPKGVIPGVPKTWLKSPLDYIGTSTTKEAGGLEGLTAKEYAALRAKQGGTPTQPPPAQPYWDEAAQTPPGQALEDALISAREMAKKKYGEAADLFQQGVQPAVNQIMPTLEAFASRIRELPRMAEEAAIDFTHPAVLNGREIARMQRGTLGSRAASKVAKQGREAPQFEQGYEFGQAPGALTDAERAAIGRGETPIEVATQGMGWEPAVQSRIEFQTRKPGFMESVGNFINNRFADVRPGADRFGSKRWTRDPGAPPRLSPEELQAQYLQKEQMITDMKTVGKWGAPLLAALGIHIGTRDPGGPRYDPNAGRPLRLPAPDVAKKFPQLPISQRIRQWDADEPKRRQAFDKRREGWLSENITGTNPAYDAYKVVAPWVKEYMEQPGLWEAIKYLAR